TPSTKLDGFMFPMSRVRMADILDGTSNTLMTSELIIVPSDTTSPSTWDTRGRIYNVLTGGEVLFTAFQPPNTTASDYEARCNPADPTTHAPCSNTTSGGAWWTYARSYHPGGVNAGLCDGSVRFVSNNISLTTWRELGTRASGAVPGSDF